MKKKIFKSVEKKYKIKITGKIAKEEKHYSSPLTTTALLRLLFGIFDFVFFFFYNSAKQFFFAHFSLLFSILLLTAITILV